MPNFLLPPIGLGCNSHHQMVGRLLCASTSIYILKPNTLSKASTQSIEHWNVFKRRVNRCRWVRWQFWQSVRTRVCRSTFVRCSRAAPRAYAPLIVRRQCLVAAAPQCFSATRTAGMKVPASTATSAAESSRCCNSDTVRDIYIYSCILVYFNLTSTVVYD